MKTGIHFKPVARASSVEKHNERDKDYIKAVEDSDRCRYHLYHDRTEMNETVKNPQYKGKTLPEVKAWQAAIVKEKTGRRLQAKATPLREGVCPILETTRPADFKPFIEWLATHKINVISISLHFDEGHTDAKTGQRKYNRHAHIVCDWIDHETGKSVKLNKEDCAEMQTILAEALGMERGTVKEQHPEKPDHEDHNTYRERKAAESAARLEAEARAARLEAERARQEAADLRRQAVAGLGAKAAAILGAGDLAKARKQAEEAEARAARLDAAYQAAQREIRQRTEAATQMAKALQDEKANTAKAKKQGEFKGVRRMAEAVAKIAGEDGPILASLAIINAKQDGAEVSDKLWKDYQCEEVAAALRKKQSPKLR